MSTNLQPEEPQDSTKLGRCPFSSTLRGIATSYTAVCPATKAAIGEELPQSLEAVQQEVAKLSSIIIEQVWGEVKNLRSNFPQSHGLCGYDFQMPEIAIPFDVNRLSKNRYSADCMTLSDNLMRGMINTFKIASQGLDPKFPYWRDLHASESEVHQQVFSRLQSLIDQGGAKSGAKDVATLIRGGLVSATASCWKLLGIAPRVHDKPLTPERWESLSSSVIKLVQSMASHDQKVFSLFISCGSWDAPESIQVKGELLPANFEIIETKDGPILEPVASMQQMLTDIYHERFGQEPRYVSGCPALHSRATSSTSVIKDLLDWIAEVNREVYTPLVLAEGAKY